ncbi:MAG: tetratricopeptide repeat protein [Scytonematopsis contorta HA4267-MV1]|jgi:tetratricopeptide (TPR) repeat protein|nr:tetratricopeptide repeat protein [Scytonematopsis contorta HA4267-MV1]
MADSVRASSQGLEIVEDARRQRGWNKTAESWCLAALTTKATLKRFWAKEAINRETFIKICQAVGVESWEDIVERYQPLNTELELKSDFVGRNQALDQLHSMVKQGAKIILIQGEGGVGKTRLARKYFKTYGFEFLELWMPVKAEDVISAESLVEEWLKRDFDEEPVREFGINLQRLRRKLRDLKAKKGILIDNLESVLDKQGEFIKSRRPYAQLLRVLADPAVNSLTLITSRERLCETNIDIILYLLRGLEESAWREFFCNRKINCQSTVISEICNAYGGNAKAMQIISGVVLKDFEGDIDAYWNENKNDLLVERELQNLVVSQFQRLQEIDIEAYRLLCRLGCYRYQDTSFVSIEGLFCLLWDVDESKRRRVINRLFDRCLLEYRKGKFWLHPVILSEAVARLRQSEDWEIANRRAADYWTKSVDSVTDTTTALKAFEAYYHYVAIEDFNQAAHVIIRKRPNQSGANESLGRSLYKRGLLEQLSANINQILSKIEVGYCSAKLYHTLATICWLSGNIIQSRYYCDHAIEIANQSLQQKLEESNLDEFIIRKLRIIQINSLLTVGIYQIGFWELEEALETFKQVIEISRGIDNEQYTPSALFPMTFLKLHFGHHQEACNTAEYLYNCLPEQGLPLWFTGYRLYYLGLTYTQLGDNEKASIIYDTVISLADDSLYTQAKNKALCGLAQLHRQQDEFSKAIICHDKAINFLSEMGAKCDLAEALYQRALTYHKMQEFDKSQEDFQRAMNLFMEMQAPKQVEKVQQAMTKNDK